MTGFEHVLVGVDGSEASFEALRQARRLLDPAGRLLAVTVCETTLAVHAGFDATRIAAELEAEAAEAEMTARGELADLPGAETRLLEGKPVPSIIGLARRFEATLIAVGPHGRSRLGGIAVGRVATAMLHDAPCSVLLARAPGAPGAFPRAIVAGVDGSAPSLDALRVAAEIAARFGATLRVLAAGGGKPLAAGLGDRVAGAGPALERDRRPPVEALRAESGRADLVVVGSRGLHGLRALGSVSERVAHQAACSVLVVRPAGLPSLPEAETAGG